MGGSEECDFESWTGRRDRVEVISLGLFFCKKIGGEHGMAREGRLARERNSSIVALQRLTGIWASAHEEDGRHWAVEAQGCAGWASRPLIVAGRDVPALLSLLSLDSY